MRTSTLRPFLASIAIAALVAACGGTPPTTAPTEPALVTGAPTDAPTDAATDAPTEAATDAPTDAPTEAATDAPSEDPGTSASPDATSGSGGSGFQLPADPNLFGTGIVPPGWQLVEDPTGACRIAAPADWTVDLLPGTAQAGALVEAMASVSADTSDWETLTTTVDTIYLPGHLTILDTEAVFLIVTPEDTDGDLGYVLAQRHDGTNCLVQGILKRNWAADHLVDMVLIAQTLAPTD